MRSFGAMFIGGVAALLAFKLVATVVFPFLAFVIGLTWIAIKLALLVALGWFIYTLVTNRKRESSV